MKHPPSPLAGNKGPAGPGSSSNNSALVKEGRHLVTKSTRISKRANYDNKQDALSRDPVGPLR